MNLNKNILSNYLAQGYIAVIAIVVIPYYIKFMGLEGYGLIGIFLLIQSIFQLFDVGLSAGIQREASRINNEDDRNKFKKIFQVFETYFFIIGMIGSVFLFIYSGLISEKWINKGTLSLDTVNLTLRIMAACIFFRWFSCLYRGVIVGREDQVWLNKINIIIATLRYILIIPIIAFIPSEPIIYFIFQLIVAGLEFSLLYFRAKFLVKISNKFSFNFNVKPIKSILNFSIGIGITGIVWSFVTQFDKLVLSKILTLADYGIFSMVISLSGGILILASPLVIAIIPRLTAKISKDDSIDYKKFYRVFSKLVILVTLPAAIILIIFSKKIIILWTSNEQFANEGYVILSLYALGNTLANIASIPFSIQYALGNIKYHVFGNLIFSIIYAPIVYFLAENYGAVGTGFAWILLNTTYILIWIPIIYRKLDLINFKYWIKNDIFIPILISLIPFIFFFNLITNSNEKYYVITLLFIAWILSTLGIIIAVKEFRDYLLKRIKF